MKYALNVNSDIYNHFSKKLEKNQNNLSNA